MVKWVVMITRGLHMLVGVFFLGCLFESGKTGKGESRDGGPPNVHGSLQKGPYLKGSAVKAVMLDGKGAPNGEAYSGAVADDSGNFSLAVPKEGWAEISGSGFYFNELTGRPSGSQAALHALIRVGKKGGEVPRVRLNVITQGAYRRAEKLMSEGRDGDSALATAEMELRRELGLAHPLGDGSARGTEMDLLGGDEPDALYLFAAACVLAKAAELEAPGTPEARVDKFLEGLAAELADRGVLTGRTKSKLIAAERSLDPDLIRANMAKWPGGKGPKSALPDLNRIIDTDKDGLANALDGDKDGDKVPDALDCAPLDAARQLHFGGAKGCQLLEGPAQVRVVSGDGEIRVSWDSVPGVTRYVLRYAEGDSPEGGNGAERDSARSGLALTGLPNGRKYGLAVNSVYGDLFSGWSPVAKGYTMSVPGGLRAVAGTGQVTLNWTPSVGAGRHHIFLRADPPTDTAWMKIEVDAPPYVVKGLTTGMAYSFAVSGAYLGFETARSGVIKSSPFLPPDKISALLGDKRAILSWSPADSGCTYNLFYAAGDTVDGRGIKLETPIPSDTVTGLNNGILYAFAVQSVCPQGVSGLGPIARAIPMAVPEVNVSAEGSRVTVTWSNAEGALGYNLFFQKGRDTLDKSAGKIVGAKSPFVFPRLDFARYGFALTSLNGGFESRMGPTAALHPLETPADVQAAMDDGMIAVTWKPSEGADSYIVYYQPGDAVDTNGFRSISKASSDTIRGLLNGNRYAIAVQAVNAGAKSSLSAIRNSVPIAIPAALTAGLESESIRLIWGPAPGASSYKVYYQAGDRVDKTAPGIPSAGSPHVLKGVQAGKTYTVAVASVNGVYESPLGAPLTLRYNSRPDLEAYGTRAVLNWDIMPPGAVYSVFYNRGEFADAGGIKRLGRASPDTILNLVNGARYAFMIEGTDRAGNKVQSSQAHIFPNVQYVGAPGFSAGLAMHTSLAIDAAGSSFVAYMDYSRDRKATVMRFDGVYWTGMGPAGFTPGPAYFTSLALNGKGEAYVAYQDMNSGSKASVMKYSGSAWIGVGEPGFTLGKASEIHLVVTNTGIPCFAYRDASDSNKVSVMAFDGGVWKLVGARGFLAGGYSPVSLAVSPNGTAFVSATDGRGQGAVMAWDGSNWVRLGGPGYTFMTLPSEKMPLAVDAGGKPHVAYTDAANNYGATVMKFDGLAWVNVGAAGFVEGASGFSLALWEDKPIVVYHAEENWLYGMIFQAGQWVPITNWRSSRFSANSALSSSLALSPRGEPFIAYRDGEYEGRATVSKISPD